MGMLSAMFSGVAGLATHGKALSSVADNIANINTHGYKASRVNFGDVMVQSLTVGGSLSTMVGTGSRVLSVQALMTQGSFESTDVNTDLAINGAGFFQVRKPNGDNNDIYYTRAGQFLLDKNGYMVNPLGYRLQGFNIDSNGDLEQASEDLQILTQQTEAIATSTVDLSINLDAEDSDEQHPSRPIDPDTSASWNYMNTVRVYDSLGISHDLALFYQRLSTYDGPVPSGAQTHWKVSVFEKGSSGYTANPTFPSNTFFLHFDTDGQLVGTSVGQPAYGDMYTASGAVSSTSSNVSDRVGESLTFTGTSSAGEQVYRTVGTIAFSGNTSNGETVTIGSDTYTFTSAMTATNAAAWLADQINSDTNHGYYAHDDGSGNLTIYSESSAYDLDETGANISVDDETTLSDVVNTINNGRAATGALNIAGLGAVGATVTLDGTNFTVPAGATTQAVASNLATLINADPNYTATATGSNVYITYASVGTAGNVSFSTSDSTNIKLSSSTLLNGLDTKNDTLVEASAVASGSSYSLRLARTDLGSSATITLGTSNTLGDNLGVDFDSWTQNQYAADAMTTSGVETDGERTLTYDFPDATADQDITFDFTPTSSSASTQSAGDSETFYLAQNGSPRGTLQSLSIDKTGLITGQFSNGTLKTLGAVTLSNVPNPNGLLREGDNLWSWALDAGDPLPATRPGSGGLGFVESGALEQSNVDLADQFVKMINYQRAFQANTRTISTTDQMLAELINLKR